MKEEEYRQFVRDVWQDVLEIKKQFGLHHITQAMKKADTMDSYLSDMVEGWEIE